jgi:hypothetical protein
MVAFKSRFLTLLALFLISSIVLVVFILSLGFYDPIAIDESSRHRKLIDLQIPSKTTKNKWLKEDLPQPPFSIRVIGNFDSGDLDSAFGLMLSQQDGIIAVMISPLGYVSVWHETSSTNTNTKDFYLPWQIWPHVHTGSSENEIYVHLNGDILSIRINRERLLEISEIDQVDRIGIMGESFGRDTMINFQLAEISTAQPVK